MLIEIKELETWGEFVELENNQPENCFIYRGHSNSISSSGTVEWSLNSSYKRFFSQNEISFELMLEEICLNNVFIFDTPLITKYRIPY